MCIYACYDYRPDWIAHFRPARNQELPQPAFTCSKLTIETLEQGMKYVQS